MQCTKKSMRMDRRHGARFSRITMFWLHTSPWQLATPLRHNFTSHKPPIYSSNAKDGESGTEGCHCRKFRAGSDRKLDMRSKDRKHLLKSCAICRARAAKPGGRRERCDRASCHARSPRRVAPTQPRCVWLSAEIRVFTCFTVTQSTTGFTQGKCQKK